MNLAGSFTIEPMRASDEPFVLSSWLHSFEKSPLGSRMDDYWARQRRVAERLIGELGVLVARPSNWPEGIAGWCCAGPRDGRFVLGYAYVKRDYRRIGLGTLLLGKTGSDEALDRVYTHLRPPHSNFLERRGFVYDRGAAMSARSSRHVAAE